MSNSKSCSNCGVVFALDTQLSLCPTCLRATGDIGADPTLDGVIRELAPTGANPDFAPTAEFFPSDPIPAQSPRISAGSLTAWEQAQVVEIGLRGYRVIRKLGDGGFGVVFLAIDAAERTVAIKMLHAALGQGKYRQRFAVEANALTRLSDPGLVQLFHFDVGGPDPMLVTEYVPGGTLAQRLKVNSVFEAAEAAEAIRQMATVIHKVHGADLIHRDIKPSNILIGADGRYKLGDFGLAKRLDRNDDLTPSGRGIGGTPEYSAPEQFRASGDCDGRADIYALGATLYRLLTGQPVFQRKDENDFFAVVIRVMSEEPVPPRKIRPSIPRELEAVCLKCLAKNPADRYRTAEELAADLKAWQAGQQMQVRPSTLVERTWSRVRRVPKFPVAMVLVTLLGLGVAFLMLNKENSQAKAGPPELPPAPDARDVMGRELAATGKIRLVGPKGLPPWHRWVIGSPELFGGLAGAGVCGFESIANCILELAPDSILDEYTLEGEIRMVASRAGVDPADHPHCGFFVCGRHVELPEASSVYMLLGQQYEDGPTARRNRNMRATSMRTVQKINELSSDCNKYGLGNLDFLPSATFPGPWRKFRIIVTTTNVSMQLVLGEAALNFNPGSIEIDPLRAATRFHERELRKDAAFAETILPPWDSHGAVGVWAYRAAVDIQNVTLYPLPTPP